MRILRAGTSLPLGHWVPSTPRARQTLEGAGSKHQPTAAAGLGPPGGGLEGSAGGRCFPSHPLHSGHGSALGPHHPAPLWRCKPSLNLLIYTKHGFSRLNVTTQSRSKLPFPPQIWLLEGSESNYLRDRSSLGLHLTFTTVGFLSLRFSRVFHLTILRLSLQITSILSGTRQRTHMALSGVLSPLLLFPEPSTPAGLTAEYELSDRITVELVEETAYVRKGSEQNRAQGSRTAEDTKHLSCPPHRAPQLDTNFLLHLEGERAPHRALQPEHSSLSCPSSSTFPPAPSGRPSSAAPSSPILQDAASGLVQGAPRPPRPPGALPT